MRRTLLLGLVIACAIVLALFFPRFHFQWKVQPHLSALASVPFDPSSPQHRSWQSQDPGETPIAVHGHQGYLIADLGSVRLAQINVGIGDGLRSAGRIPTQPGTLGLGSSQTSIQGQRLFQYEYDGKTTEGRLGKTDFSIEKGTLTVGTTKVEIGDDRLVLVGEDGNVLYVGKR